MPDEHDGRTLFGFELRFSEELPGSSGLREELRTALQVTNGTVREMKRVWPKKNHVWTIGVRPDSHRDVAIELPATTDCDTAGAVCAEDGRPLSNRASATVEGPPPITASFHGMPEKHDGRSLFRFELRFSEEFRGTPGLRDNLSQGAFQVTNGTVREANRASPGKNRVWKIGVRPDSHGNVTIELPATTDCDAEGAVCAEVGRPLSNSASAEVAGPSASAQANGPVVLLAWPTPRDSFAAPDGSDFGVRADGGLRAVTTVSLWVRGAVLRLAEPVLPGQEVLVD